MSWDEQLAAIDEAADLVIHDAVRLCGATSTNGYLSHGARIVVHTIVMPT